MNANRLYRSMRYEPDPRIEEVESTIEFVKGIGRMSVEEPYQSPSVKEDIVGYSYYTERWRRTPAIPPRRKS